MRIKKKELRKRLAQLPINYPAPAVDASFDSHLEKERVETLCKRLANNEVEIRDATLAELPAFLRKISESFLRDVESMDSKQRAQRKADLELVMQKLCMGIFYCYWHSDKPLVQHECAFQISKLLFDPPTHELRAAFARSLFRVLVREWSKIDHYRLDKYMALVRKIVFQLICFLSQVEQGIPVGPVTLRAEGAFISAVVSELPSSVRKQQRAKAGSSSSLKDKKAANAEENGFGAIYAQIAALFQDDVLQDIRSVGLTMHICDLFFDELVRSEASPSLFVALSKDIPLFAMSKGNYVEKRVLDHFFAPLTGGMLQTRRLQQRTGSATTTGKGGKVDESTLEAELAAENHEIVRQLVTICQDYSVSKGTVRQVRLMFSEAQLLLEQMSDAYAAPGQMTEVRPRDLSRRLKKEVDEANATRLAVVKERRDVRSVRKTDRVREFKKGGARSKSVGSRNKDMDDFGGEIDPRKSKSKSSTNSSSKKDGSKKKVVRNTKRKKNYVMTKADYMGDD